MTPPRSALAELILARMREFWREPEAIFWVYGFPVLLMVGLGIAFRSEGPPPEVSVAVVEGPRAAGLAESLRAAGGFDVAVLSESEARERLRKDKAELVVLPEAGSGVRYVLDPARAGAVAARLQVDAALQKAAGRAEAFATTDDRVTAPGSRYVDWLIPGLLGMGIMGGGLWGLGYVTVEFRMRKLLKRFVATPMRRSHFLLALIVSRLIFLVPETLILLLAGVLIFGFSLQGALLPVFVAILLGAACFAGLGLLVACRAAKLEVVSGLMNLVMLPMWVLSGNFFSSTRFPDVMQPFVQALPLTQLNNLLRALMLDGAPLSSQLLPIGVLAGCAVLSFALALRWFKWT